MAGAGYKLFNTGDVLLASEVNTYLQQQVTMVFANATARTSALSGVLAEGMMSYLQDTNTVEVYNGSSWVSIGGTGDITEVQAGTGISVASGTGPIPVVTNTVATTFDAAGDLVYGTGADTFTKLSLGTAGQVLTVNSGATAPEWKTASSGSTFAGCRVHGSGTQSIANATQTLITWDSETFDTDSYHSTTTNTGRITIPSGKAGYYLVNCGLRYESGGNGQRDAYLIKNSGGVDTQFSLTCQDGDEPVGLQLTGIIYLAVSDYVRVETYQNSGGSTDVGKLSVQSFFSVGYLGA